MDIDAIVIFMRVLCKSDINENDKLLMKSAIKNVNIDINISLSDNLKVLEENNVNTEVFKIVDDKIDFFNIPIYSLLLQKRELRELLLLSHKSNLLKDEALLDIIETMITFLSIADEKEYPELSIFLNDLLSVRRINNSKLFQSSIIIKSFILSNHGSLSADLSKVVGINSIKNFYNRLIILKLYSHGFANFSFEEIADPSIDTISMIVEPLLQKRSYGHLRLVINSKTITSIQALRVKELVNDHLKDIKIDSLEDSIKLEKFINDLNNILRFINTDALININNHILD